MYMYICAKTGFFLFLFGWQTPLHCGGDLGRVPFKGYRNCCRLGPDAWDEGFSFLLCVLSPFCLFIAQFGISFCVTNIYLNVLFNFIGSLVRIRLESLPFHKVAVEWQHEPAVLLVWNRQRYAYAF